MDNEKLCETIYEFIKYCDKSSCEPFGIYVHMEEQKNMNFIKNWIQEVWSKEK